jgi:outer membrane receptor protein involved in Fe transport
MNVRHLLRAAATLALAVGLAAPAWTQINTGVIDGRAMDESKALVAAATITARNVATGLTRTTTSSATGNFRLASLPAGTYDVTVELKGFATTVLKAVDVRVASTVNLDVVMKVSAQMETVTVTGETPLISTTTSDVGQVITSTVVENIPLNGRKFQDLSLLVPGTRPANYYDPTKTEVGGISYGGATGRNVIINVDGGDNNDGVVRGLLQQFTAEAIQEYKVTTQRYSAEFGRSTGGVVNVITKSGTNAVRGSLFGFWRNDSFNSRTFFQEEQDIEKPPFEQWMFGGSVGGPIKQDKSHYFVAYERNVRDDYTTVSTGGVLPAEEGNFAQPFRNNLLTAKLDFALNDTNNLVLRYSLEDQKRDHDFIGGNVLSSAGAINTNKIHSAVAKNTTVIGTTKVNELLAVFQNFENNILSEDNTKPGIRTPDFFFGANLNTPQQTIQRRWQLRDDFSFRKEGWGGDHAFKVGAEVIRSHYGGFFVPTLYGYFIYNDYPAGCGSPCTDINAYLNSVADTFTGSAGDNEFDDNWTYLAGYIQDDWRPSRNLTLNLGLRYEIQWGPYTNEFDTIALRALATTGYSTRRSNDYNNIGPRVGFAWDVKGDGRTVVRGGYGRYYDEIFSNITLYEYWSQVSSPTFFVSQSPSAFTPNQYAANRDAIRNSFLDPTFAGQPLRLTAPDLEQPYMDQLNAGLSWQATNRLAFDVDYVFADGKAEVHRWRVNTPQNVNTRISPAGVFAVNPDYGNTLGAFIVEGNRGHSKFHGVYVAGKYRTSKTNVMATYAWSDAKNISNGFNTQPSDITNANFEQDWGYTPNDIRHRFTLAGVWQLPAGFQLATAVQGNTGKPFDALAGLGGLRNAVRATNPATGAMFERNVFRAGPEVANTAGGNGGLAFFSWDLRLSRVFKLGGEKSLEVLAEVFNITDHANFDRDSYQTNYNSANFGNATEIIRNSNRQGQIGARLRF